MKTKLISLLLVLAFALSLVSCAGKNVSEADTTDAETTETEDTETNDRPRMDIPMWLLYTDTRYAIVKIKEPTPDTEQINDSDFYYQRFICRLISSSHKSFPSECSLYIAEDPEQKLNPGDYIFFQADYLSYTPKRWYAASGSRSMSEYKVFTDGAIELTDNDLQGFFHPLSEINEYVLQFKNSSSQLNITPSFPTKELCGKVTVEEASDFLDSVKKTSDEFLAYMNDPEVRKHVRF